MFKLELYKDKSSLIKREVNESVELNNLQKIESLAKEKIAQEKYYKGIIYDEFEILESISQDLSVDKYIGKEFTNLYVGFIYQCCERLGLNEDVWYRLRGNEENKVILDKDGENSVDVSNQQVLALLDIFLRNVGDLTGKYIANVVFNARDVLEKDNLFMYYTCLKDTTERVSLYIRK